jgi:3-phenylpropionate/trans-cinnamate dioxygenase ferredoxin subunit
MCPMYFTTAALAVARVRSVDGTTYAIDDSCAHAGSSLGAGNLEAKMVTCRGHGLKYDVTNGYVGGVPGFGVASYPAKVVDGNIMVAI